MFGDKKHIKLRKQSDVAHELLTGEKLYIESTFHFLNPILQAYQTVLELACWNLQLDESARKDCKRILKDTILPELEDVLRHLVELTERDSKNIIINTLFSAAVQIQKCAEELRDACKTGKKFSESHWVTPVLLFQYFNRIMQKNIAAIWHAYTKGTTKAVRESVLLDLNGKQLLYFRRHIKRAKQSLSHN